MTNPFECEGNYILNDEGEPEECRDLLKWAEWRGQHDGERVLLQTRIGEAFISTVFLAVDYNHFHEGPPILWETMVFDGPPGLEYTMWRYRSKLEALEGHVRAVEEVNAALRKVP
jgi:hypothetical protein